MRCVLLLSFVPLVLCADMYFICNDRALTAMPEGAIDTVDNQVAGKFILAVHKTYPLTYSAEDRIEVTLRSRDPASMLRIRQFLVVARTPCDTCDVLTPVGSWDVAASNNLAVSGNCADAADAASMAYEADATSEVDAINVVWRAPAGSRNAVEFVASVIASDGKAYHQIRSPFLTPFVDEESVHTDPREDEGADYEEYVDEEEEYNGGEAEEAAGPYEDPNEGERVEEEEREESLRRDHEEEEEDMDKHDDARAEEEMKILEEERRRQQLMEEDSESEAMWVSEKYQEMKAMEEEFQSELMAYERDVAEEDRKRQEMIIWEIRDKEEHDKLMAIQEEEEERNRTPKEEDVMTKPDEEITVIEEVVVVQESSAGSVTASVAMVTLAAILKFFF